MHRPSVVIAACAALGLALTACSSADTVVSEKKAPDSQQAYQEPALSLPPDYGQRPTKAADDPANEVARRERERAKKRLEALQAAASDGKMSTGTAALLEETKVPEALPNIRTVLSRETTIFAHENPAFVDKLVFGTDIAAAGGSAADGKAGTGSGSGSEIVLRQGKKGLF